MAEVNLRLKVNGEHRQVRVEPRTTLADALRTSGLTGTHIGCEHGACGACTVLIDGAAMRSCLLFAIQVGEAEVTTVEGLCAIDGSLTPLQRAFRDCHGLQCGFCTPGFIVSMTDYLSRYPDAAEEELRLALAGNLCRCTGYQGIIRAVRKVKTTVRQ